MKELSTEELLDQRYQKFRNIVPFYTDSEGRTLQFLEVYRKARNAQGFDKSGPMLTIPRAVVSRLENGRYERLSLS